MDEYSVGFFVVPVAHLDELHRLETEAHEAPNQILELPFYLQNQVFCRANEVAVASAIVASEYDCNPLVENDLSTAHTHMAIWLSERLDGDERYVLDPEQLARLAPIPSEVTLAEYLQWAHECEWTRDRVVDECATALFEALVQTLRAMPSQPCGFVCTDFDSKYRDRPEPEPEPRRYPITPEDKAKINEIWDRILANSRYRHWYEDWVESKREGRMLMGLIEPEQGAELDREFVEAIDLYGIKKPLAGEAAMKVLMPRIERALIEPWIETLAGPVTALAFLRIMVEWDTPEDRRAVITPEEAISLDQRLDQLESDRGGEVGLIKAIWKHEKHWTRDLVRTTCRHCRSKLRRAIERGMAFVWVRDLYTGR